MKEDRRTEPGASLVNGLLGGFFYGAAVAGLSHPWDTIKTRLQTGTTPLRSFYQGATSPAHGGVRGLYRGFIPALAGSVMFRSVPFALYEGTTAFLREDGSVTQPLVVAGLGGVCGGLGRALLETPFEYAKTRAQSTLLERGGPAAAAGPPGGPLRVYTGLGATAARNAAVTSLFWVFMEASKPGREWLAPVRERPTLSAFMGGGACSVAAWAVIYPLDTYKSRVQAAHRAAPAALGSASAAYAGIGPGLVRVFVANGAGFAVYQKVLSLLSHEKSGNL